MKPRSWSHVLDLFRQAIELAPRERARFLDERCDDAEARDALERMIAADEAPAGPLDTPPAVSLASLADRPAPGLGLGDTVGAYRVLRVIASGGMSTVYEAEQERPRRRVALKTLRPGFLIGSVAGRFRLEAEVLGSLQHPGVARVYESGVHETPGASVPFIAMELVEGGRDLLSHGRTLGHRARLGLFLEVCDAVHHAHQKGVIHRDLKPSNVLVDARGSVKVIDFGLARVSDRERFQLSFGPTETGRAAGTLLYMSPEQLAGRRDAIDVRCDVYALGVLLFELSSGTHPFQVEGRSVTELARALEEAEPRRLGEVSSECRGDLEWITSRAMARERERRYPTVHELALDVRRYLHHEPVVAGPPSGWYRFRKLVRRHRFGFGLASAIGAVGLAGLGTTLWQMNVARVRTQERNVQLEIAGQASGFLERAFTSIRPEAARGEELSLGAFVDRTARTLELAPPEHPAVEASLRRTLGITYRELGRHEEALRHLERAHALTCARHGPDDERSLAAQNDLLEVRLQAEVTSELEALVDDTLRRARAALGEGHDVTRAALLNRVRFCFEAGRFAQAERLLRDSLPDFARSSDPDLYRNARLELAGALVRQGRIEDSAALFEELRRESEARDELDPTRLVDEGNLITALVAAGRYDGVDELQRSLVERMIRVLGDEHPLTVGAMADYGHCLARAGRTHEALPWLERVREACRASAGDALTGHVGALVSAGQAFVELGRLDPAQELLEAALAIDEAQTEERSPRRPQAMLCLANVCRLRGEPELAEAWLVDGERRALEVLGPDHYVTLMLQNNLALIRIPRDGRRQAIAVLERTAARAVELYGPDDTHHALLFRYNLGSLLLEVGELERAQEILTDVRRRRVRKLGEDHSDVLLTDQSLAHLLWLTGQRRESERLQRSLVDRRLARSGPDHPHTVHALQQYVGLLLSEGRDQEARPWQRRLEAAREALQQPAN